MSHLSEINVPEKAPRRIGIVESDARDMTRKVVINYSVKHPKYGKYIRRRTVLQVHDAKNESHNGVPELLESDFSESFSPVEQYRLVFSFFANSVAISSEFYRILRGSHEMIL